MNIDDMMASIWGEKVKPPRVCCIPACQFTDFAEALYLDARDDALGSHGLVSVNQKKLTLLDKYFEYRSVVPKSHRDYRGSGHRCIWHVFEEYYNKLRVIELRLTPPMLYIPLPPPPPTPPPQIEGLILGEEE